MRAATKTPDLHQTLDGFSSPAAHSFGAATASDNAHRDDDIVALIYRMRWVPIALMGLISLAPNFGWG